MAPSERVQSARTGRRVVLMMEQAWPGLYLSTQLARAGLLTAVIVQRESLDGVAWSIAGLRRAARTAGLRPAIEAFLGCRYGLTHVLGRLWNSAEYPYLGDLRKLGVAVHRVPAFLSPQCHELLRSLSPDVSVICGTPILPESLLSIARICTINTHTSILPYYRGGGSLFWPLFFRDIEKVGITIHKAVPAVDAGPYFHQEAIPVHSNDTPKKLLRRSYLVGAKRMIDLLRESPLDKTAYKEYQKPLRHAWRAPDAVAKRYMFGPTLRQRAASFVQKAAWALKINPFRNAVQGGIIFFYFHRALAPGTPRHDWRRVMGHPTADELREKLLYVRRRFEVISLTQALSMIDARHPMNGRYAVITADDGYRDFRTQFLPLVTELNLPAALFVCTGAIVEGAVWFQKLYDMIEGICGDRLYLPWADRKIYFGNVQHRVITIERVIAPYLKRLGRNARQQRMAQLLEHNPTQKLPHPTDAFCGVDDLWALKSSRLIELHLHSHGHDPYETLTEAELEQDVLSCQQFFETSLGVHSKVLSYPNGRFNADMESVLARLGIRHAFSTTPGLNRPPVSRNYALCRIGLSNEAMPAFHWGLCKWIADRGDSLVDPK